MNPHLSRLLSSSFLLLSLSACATVPAPGRGLVNPPTLRPVKPLMEGRGKNIIVVSKDPKSPTSQIKREPPTSKSGKPTQSSTKPMPINELKAKLQDAEDKSTSASSLSQSAQTPEDWQLVVQRWQKSIDILKPLSTQNTSMAAQIRQALADARVGQARAQQQAQEFKGSAAPLQVDRSRSGTSQGFIYGATPSPTPSSSKAPTPNPTQSSPSPKN